MGGIEGTPGKVAFELSAEILRHDASMGSVELNVGFNDGILELSAREIISLASRLGADDQVRIALPVAALAAEAAEQSHLSFLDGSVRVDRQRFELLIDDEVIYTAYKEFSVIEILALNAGKLVTRGQIAAHAWGPECVDIWERNPKMGLTLNAHIQRCRRKLGSYGWMLQTRRGVGFIFSEHLLPDDPGDE